MFRTRIIWAMLFSGLVYGQNYHYTFSISSVSNLAEAKEVTDPIRRLFNTASNQFEVYPYFKEESKEFDFESTVDVNAVDLISRLMLENGQLLSFKKETL